MTSSPVLIIYAIIALVLTVFCSRGDEPRELLESVLKWTDDSLELKLKRGEVTAKFEFIMQNVSPNSIIIQQINTSCGCTQIAGKVLPFTLKSQEKATIPIVMDVTGKSGTLTKTLLVVTDMGDKTLFVTSHITPSEANQEQRKNNQIMAKANRQVVLQGSCATCHVQPAEDKLGMELFHTACSICHEADHRAEFVPDLNPMRGNKRDASYWRVHIREGRKDTLMPSFAKETGGFLSTAQVESLINYLLEPLSQ